MKHIIIAAIAAAVFTVPALAGTTPGRRNDFRAPPEHHATTVAASAATNELGRANAYRNPETATSTGSQSATVCQGCSTGAEAHATCPMRAEQQGLKPGRSFEGRMPAHTEGSSTCPMIAEGTNG